MPPKIVVNRRGTTLGQLDGVALIDVAADRVADRVADRERERDGESEGDCAPTAGAHAQSTSASSASEAAKDRAVRITDGAALQRDSSRAIGLACKVA